VVQEILHRYAAIDKREAITPALQLLLGVVDDVLAIEKAGRPAEPVKSFRIEHACPPAIAYTLRSWAPWNSVNT
jgi:hypothetical protein